jgi:hypothetical protein
MVFLRLLSRNLTAYSMPPPRFTVSQIPCLFTELPVFRPNDSSAPLCDSYMRSIALRLRTAVTRPCSVRAAAVKERDTTDLHLSDRVGVTATQLPSQSCFAILLRSPFTFANHTSNRSRDTRSSFQILSSSLFTNHSTLYSLRY